MIRFEGVKKVYEDGFQAVKQLDLQIQEGELVTLIGPSGCGKTTTMKMVNKLIEPTEGKIYVAGQDISTVNAVELRRNIGYVIQQIGLLPHMTIADNISLIPKLKGWSREQYTKRVDELLDLVGLDPSLYREKYPLELSGGQQQRVGVVRALAAEPPIVLMDEPFSALDPISREQLQDELKILQKNIKKTIVFVTHDIDEALKISDRMIIMKEGEIVQIDSPEQILKNPKNGFVIDFIGENRLGNKSSKKVMDLMMPNQLNYSSISFKTDTDGTYVGAFQLDHEVANYPVVYSDQELTIAVRLLIEQTLDIVPVLTKERQLVGMISKDQLLSYYSGIDGKEVQHG
ncbi:ABC transporter ATP-binding protein [Cytobacillus spongiae]|jgi:osmoprotectant transport system ATP-binding protein|uniref:ABC transporter ATP-binding protein n=1 Tax=Cytobacillus spongiae TaxID=2901381 RepID=UPI0025465599|nr:ABC transporter ATP-binding protein [Cytobacillus spongiae]